MYVTESLGIEEIQSASYEKKTNLPSQGGLQLHAFDPQLFRHHAEIAIARLENHLADTSIRGLALTEPAGLLQTARNLMNSKSGDIAIGDDKKLGAILDLYIKTGIQVHSPGYMGRQFSGVVPLAGVVDFVSSIINQPSSFYEAAQLPSVAERIMAEELNRFIGWAPEQFAMITTSGGSLANLTAILAARNDKFPQCWSQGIGAVAGQPRPAIAVGDDAHYSVCRAAGILGIGEDQIVRLPLNHKKQICPQQARQTLADASARGLRVFCLIASAGTTSTGAFDPIDELADIAEEQDIWLHIDGAHGASLLVSDTLRHKLKGIERVDSLAWDAHKMLFVPAMCTLLFYKDKAKSFGAFRQNASYVFEKEPDIYTEYDSAEQNFECTKRPLIMNLWVLWTLYGPALFAEKIEYLCDLALHAYHIINAQEDFETVHRPECNILCFRYLPANLQASNYPDFQVAIRNRIRGDGKFFISKVDVDEAGALRIVMMNHQITTAHIEMLLQEIRIVGQQLLSGHTR